MTARSPVPPAAREAIKAEKDELRQIRREIKQRQREERQAYGRCINKYTECSPRTTLLAIGNVNTGLRNVEVPTVYCNIIKSEHWYHVDSDTAFQCTVHERGPVRDIIRTFTFGRDPEFIRTIALRRLIALLAWGKLGRVSKTYVNESTPYCYIPLESLTCNVWYTDNMNIKRFYTPTTWKD